MLDEMVSNSSLISNVWNIHEQLFYLKKLLN